MTTGTRVLSGLLLAAAFATGCGSWRLLGDDPGPDPGVLVPRLFDAAAAYREMGLLTAADPVPFVATLRFLAGPRSDSTTVALALSFANSALSFRRNGLLLEARYRVEVTFWRDSAVVQQFGQEQTVQVGTLAETIRTDESVIFQRYVAVSPGPVRVRVVVRDLRGTTFSRVEAEAEVPVLAPVGVLSSLIPVYRASARTAVSDHPDLVVNPRATVSYGESPLRFYLEGYGWPPQVPVVLRALSEEQDPAQSEVWRDTILLETGADVAAAVVSIPVEALPIGRVRVEAFGGRDTVQAAALVTFSDQWVVVNYEETLVLLRYFATEAALDRLRAAPPHERPQVWRAFWEESDPDPRTAEHEALEAYFSRLQVANDRFGEGSDPGWLTDRGEVFISLGEPDEIEDSSSDLQGRGGRWIRWSYVAFRLTLDFVDETGFGRFRLNGASRSAFLQALERVRFGQ